MSGSDLFGFENELRRARPEPEFEFLRALEARVLAPPPARPRRRGARIAAAVALSAALAAALGATGGLSYAASSLAHAVRAASTPTRAIAVRGLTADGDQYRPGFGFGDPNHNHSGPPGLEAKGESSSFTPPAQPKVVDGGKAVVATTQLTLDEQAVLYIQVVDKRGRPVLLTQQGSKVGGGATAGPQTKTLVYKVLVPRTIPLALRVPRSVLAKGTYSIRVVAVDPQGNRSTLLVPFAV